MARFIRDVLEGASDKYKANKIVKSYRDNDKSKDKERFNKLVKLGERKEVSEQRRG